MSIEEIKKLVSKGKISEGIAGAINLAKSLGNKELERGLNLLSARFNDIEQKTHSDYSTQKNQIIYGLLDIVDELERQESEKEEDDFFKEDKIFLEIDKKKKKNGFDKTRGISFEIDDTAGDTPDENLKPPPAPSPFPPPPSPAPETPPKGVLLHSIPHEMQLNNQHRCVFRIAYDKKTALSDLSTLLENVTVKENIRLSDVMEIEFEPSKYFEIIAVNDAEQLVEKGEYTEWNFDVRPLAVGNFPLTFKVSIILEKGRKQVTLTESVQIVTEPVESAMEFVVSDLKEEKPTTAIANNSTVSGNNNVIIQGSNNNQINIGDNTDNRNTENKKKILFLAANPKEQARLQSDKEYRIIRAEMERGSHRDLYEFLQPSLSLTITELIRALNDKPQIVHFSGHGTEDGIVITTENNTSQTLATATLSRLFKPLKGITELVLLNSCYSSAQAKSLSELGITVVANNLSVLDNAAISFAKGLYVGLSDGKTFAESFNNAMIVLETEFPNANAIVEVWKNGVLSNEF